MRRGLRKIGTGEIRLPWCKEAIYRFTGDRFYYNNTVSLTYDINSNMYIFKYTCIRNHEDRQLEFKVPVRIMENIPEHEAIRILEGVLPPFNGH